MAQTFKPPKTQRVYDVCVIGSQLGGAVAGALLARRGYRVLHIDHDGLGTSYEDGGYLLPYAPAVFPSPRAFPAAQDVLTELGLTTDISRHLEPANPDLQILLPRHRVDLHREPAQRLAELKREWPADAEMLEAALVHIGKLFDASSPFMKSMPPLPPDGFAERRAVAKAIRFAASAPGSPSDRVGEVDPLTEMAGHPLARSLQAFYRFVAYIHGPPPPLGLTRLVGAALKGTFWLPGGYESLRELCRRKIAESRGDLLGADAEPAIAESFDLDGGRVASVRLAGSPDAYVARAFIAATDAPAVRRLIPASERSGKLAKLLDQVRPVQQLLTLNLVVKSSALPPALGDTVLALHDPLASDAVEKAILIQVLPARKDVKRGQGEIIADERILCAAAFVPAAVRDMGEAHLLELAAGIRAAVADAVPFFERHLITESIPALAAAASGRARGSRLLPHPHYDLALDSTLGVTGLPVRAPYKNLFFAGREVVPGLGIEGEFHSGLQAANLIGGMLGRKELLK